MSVDQLRYVLHPDVEQVPMGSPGEVLVARRGSRVPPQLLSGDAMALLASFREPATLVDAVLAYSRSAGVDPMATLDEAFGVLVALTRSDVLVVADAASSDALQARHQVDDAVGPARLTEPVRVLTDSEVWRAALPGGRRAVVKVVADEGHGDGLVARELAALERVSGLVAPRLVWAERTPAGGTLVLEEVDGDPADLTALAADDAGRDRLAARVVEAYTHLHALGVLHGDVHPGNVLVGADGHVALIDFGLAVVDGDLAPRTAGGEYLDPQAADALLRDERSQPLDAAAEQYSVAVLVFTLLAGAPPLDLECERTQALRRIATGRPRPFVALGATPRPAVERVLRRALAVDPSRRYRSMRTFRDALTRALDVPAVPLPPEPDLTALLVGLDTDGATWAHADVDRAAHVAWLLERVATLTGDALAHDLALLWSTRCGHAAPPTPQPGTPVARAHRALATHARTGGPAALRRARAVAGRMGVPSPDEPVDVLAGGWAGALLRLECAHPAAAAQPGARGA